MTMPNPRTPVPDAPRAAPLWAVHAFTFLGSLGTGLVTNGLYFLADAALGYGKSANYLLALFFGAAYIAGALAIGPALRALARRSDRVSTRAVLAALLLLLAAACALPFAAQAITGRIDAWPIWVLAAIYAPFTGALWPIVESYLSGGRRDKELRHATGAFNIIWASAVAASLWLGAPLVEPQPLLLLALLGLVHIASLALLLPMGREPGRHLSDAPHAVHPMDRALLAVFRILLPTSYLVSATLNPFLPSGLAALGVSALWAPPMAATWMVTRVAVFALMQRWHGWRHATATPIVGAALLLAGFALAVGAPRLAMGMPTSLGIACMLLGLAAFGAGMATIYAAALYYAMEVGAAEVDAGGAHEALIGLGYTLGPLIGLAALAMTAPPSSPNQTNTLPVSFETLVILLVTALSLAAAFAAFALAAKRRAREPLQNRA